MTNMRTTAKKPISSSGQKDNRNAGTARFVDHRPTTAVQRRLISGMKRPLKSQHDEHLDITQPRQRNSNKEKAKKASSTNTTVQAFGWRRGNARQPAQPIAMEYHGHDATMQRCYDAAKTFIDDKLNENTISGLAFLYRNIWSVLTTAKAKWVKQILVDAMTRFSAVHTHPEYYGEMLNKRTFGTMGSCEEVSIVLSYLLNKIYGSAVTRHYYVYNGGDQNFHFGITLSNRTGHIDATYRQFIGADSGDGLAGGNLTAGQVENMPMVATSRHSYHNKNDYQNYLRTLV